MIKYLGKDIINIVINGHIIYKGVIENNVIYEKQVNYNCRNIINTGDFTKYYIEIQGKQYIPNIICNNDRLIIHGDTLYFSSSGEYNIIFNYKSYNVQVNFNVIDCTLVLS